LRAEGRGLARSAVKFGTLHVWTAPPCQGDIDLRSQRESCGHVYGLLV
jgi:hypothetical protein